MDIERFCMALEWSRGEGPAEKEPAEIQAEWIGQKMREACDLVAPKLGVYKTKWQTYWWNVTIEELRKNCINKRRMLTRFNGGREHRRERPAQPDPQEQRQQQLPNSPGRQQESGERAREKRELQTAYKEARKELREEINKAKLKT